MDDLAIYQNLIKYRQIGQPCILATVVESKGGTPRNSGAKMLILENGKTIGTIGGGCVEGKVKAIAKRFFQDKPSCTIVSVDLAGEPGQAKCDVCGGSMKILLEK